MAENDEAAMDDASEAMVLAGALNTIVQESEEADTVRIALGALQRTAAGRQIMDIKPIVT